MLFFLLLLLLTIQSIFIVLINKPSLWTILSICKSNSLYFFHKEKIRKKYIRKRAFSFILSRKMRGSMTLETALVFPIFLFAIFSLIALIDVVRIESCMDVAVSESGNEISLEYYSGCVTDLTLPVLVSQKINSFLEDNLSSEDKKKLSSTITVTNMSISQASGKVNFQVDYSITPDFQFFGLNKIYLSSTYCGHTWSGYTLQEKPEEMVFITDRATVYHTDKNCTYLNLTIYEVRYEELETKRNNNCRKYKKCSFCNMMSNTGTVFITAEGECYHNIRTCIGLTRYIYTVPLSMVSNKQECLRCGEK